MTIMYSLLFIFLGLVTLTLIGKLILILWKRKSLIFRLGALFIISFFTSIILFQYYSHFYLGSNTILQKIYFSLFWFSVFLYFLIVYLWVFKYFKKEKL